MAASSPKNAPASMSRKNSLPPGDRSDHDAGEAADQEKHVRALILIVDDPFLGVRSPPDAAGVEPPDCVRAQGAEKFDARKGFVLTCHSPFIAEKFRPRRPREPIPFYNSTYFSDCALYNSKKTDRISLRQAIIGADAGSCVAHGWADSSHASGRGWDYAPVGERDDVSRAARATHQATAPSGKRRVRALSIRPEFECG